MGTCRAHDRPACLTCASREPNLQNIPVNTPLADRIRRSFIRHFPAYGLFDIAWLEHHLVQGTIADTSIMSEMYMQQKEHNDGQG